MKKENKGFEYVTITENVIALVPAKPTDDMYDASESVIITCIALPKELIFIDCGSYPELGNLEKTWKRNFKEKPLICY